MLIKTSQKSQEEDEDQSGLPVPTQIVSNGEFWPIPQTPKQKLIEGLVRQMADERAKKLGVSRRQFLQSSAGMATALSAINIVHGCGTGGGGAGGFAVEPCSTEDPTAANELFSSEFFILDSQTHHVETDGVPNVGTLTLEQIFSGCNPESVGRGDCTPFAPGNLSRTNYIKEILIDSETTVAMMSGVPAPTTDTQAISNDSMAATRCLANELGASERCIMQGMLTPNIPNGAETGLLGTLIKDIPRLVEELGIRALKTYTGAGGPNSFLPFRAYPGWWLDEEETAYKMYEEALKNGVNVVNNHKGFAQGIFDPEFCSPRDVPKAVRDWPEINFVVFHSAVDGPPYEHYFDELIELRTNEIPDADNVYTELGGAWSRAVLQGPEASAHFLGKLLNAFGADRILWGTDAIWSGSPQWQINALKVFQMPESLMEEFGYPAVTDEIKAKIFGLNAAELYGVDPEAVRYTIPESALGKAAAACEELGIHEPSLRTYGPKTRRDFLRMVAPATPT